MLSTAGSVSELSSLHDGDVDFRQTYRQGQKKALQPISDPSNEPHTASTAHRLRPAHCQSSRAEEKHDSRYKLCACACVYVDPLPGFELCMLILFYIFMQVELPLRAPAPESL